MKAMPKGTKKEKDMPCKGMMKPQDLSTAFFLMI